MIDKGKVKYYVEKALGYQFETYSWSDMIDDIEDLDEEEKQWAKEHTTYSLFIE